MRLVIGRAKAKSHADTQDLHTIDRFGVRLVSRRATCDRVQVLHRNPRRTLNPGSCVTLHDNCSASQVARRITSSCFGVRLVVRRATFDSQRVTSRTPKLKVWWFGVRHGLRRATRDWLWPRLYQEVVIKIIVQRLSELL